MSGGIKYGKLNEIGICFTCENTARASLQEITYHGYYFENNVFICLCIYV